MHRPVWAPQDDAGAAPVDPAAAGDPPPEAGSENPPADQAAAPAPTEVDYSFLPDEFRQDGANDIEGFRARFDDLTAQSAQREEAMQDVPDDGTGYEFSVPDDLDFGDLDLPEGFSFNLKTDGPAMAPVFEEFGGLLHKYNLPKSAASEFMGALAKYQAAEYAPLYAQSKAEMKTLGSGADSRVANIDRALTSRLPTDQAAALKAATTTANGVKALEALLQPRSMKTPTPTPSATNFEGLTGSARLKAINEAEARK